MLINVGTGRADMARCGPYRAGRQVCTPVLAVRWLWSATAMGNTGRVWRRPWSAMSSVPLQIPRSRYGDGVSTFMAYGAVDLRADVAADAFVAAFERELAREKTADHPVAVWVNDHGEHARVTLLADWGNIWLGPVVARAAGDVQRALVGLDHDEYGVEHVVFDGRGGALLRVHHVYVYPHGEPDEQYAPTLAGLPARADLTANPDGTLTGVDALAAAAALYHVAARTKA